MATKRRPRRIPAPAYKIAPRPYYIVRRREPLPDFLAEKRQVEAAPVWKVFRRSKIMDYKDEKFFSGTDLIDLKTRTYKAGPFSAPCIAKAVCEYANERRL